MMNCRQATKLLSEKMERPLSAREKMTLRLHTVLCSSCRQFGHHLQEIREISKSYTKNKSKNSKK
jgi:sporulation-control protein spo0M